MGLCRHGYYLSQIVFQHHDISWYVTECHQAMVGCFPGWNVTECHHVKLKRFWCFMTYGDIWWHLMTFNDFSWQNHVVYHDMSWYIMICHDMTPTNSESILYDGMLQLFRDEPLIIAGGGINFRFSFFFLDTQSLDFFSSATQHFSSVVGRSGFSPTFSQPSWWLKVCTLAV